MFISVILSVTELCACLNPVLFSLPGVIVMPAVLHIIRSIAFNIMNHKIFHQPASILHLLTPFSKAATAVNLFLDFHILFGISEAAPFYQG